jgi:hypothetical protein
VINNARIPNNRIKGKSNGQKSGGHFEKKSGQWG